MASLASARHCSMAPLRPSARSLTARCGCSFDNDPSLLPITGSERKCVALPERDVVAGPAAIKLHICKPEAGQLQGAKGLAATLSPSCSICRLVLASSNVRARQSPLQGANLQACYFIKAVAYQVGKASQRSIADLFVLDVCECSDLQSIALSPLTTTISVCRPILRAQTSVTCSWIGAGHVPCDPLAALARHLLML